MNEKQEFELLHEISKTGATGALVALLRMRLEKKLAALREENAKDWLTRSISKSDELWAQISEIRSMLFDFEMFGEHPARTVIDHETYTMKVVTEEEYIELRRKEATTA